MAAGSINALIGAQRSGSVIDRIANPPSVNPLAGIQAGADAAKTVMGVRALAGQQAWGEALQQATDPTSGRVDYGKAQSILAADPRGTLAMQGAATDSSGLMNDQVSRAHYQMGLVHAIVGGLSDNASRADITAALDRLGPLGISPTDLAADKAAIPTDDKALPGFIQQFRAAPESGPTQLNMRYGTPGMANVGGALQPYLQAPANQGAAATTAPGALSYTLTPSEATGMVVSKDPNSNQEVKEPLATFLQRHGYTLPGQPAGRAQTTAPVAGASPPAAPALPPPVVSGAPPDVAAKWDASTKQYTDANEAAGNYQQRIFPLVQAYNIIKSGTVTTGQSADAWNQIRGTLQTAATKMGWDAQSIAQANSEQLAKYTQQYINAQGMSARSDQALASAITGNPGSHISTLANEQVMPAMIGMERMRQMLLADFKAQPGDKSSPRNFSDFSNTWQNTHDPRAFIFDMMGDGERTKMVQSMAGNDATSKAARKRFSDTLDIVERNPGIMGQAALPH